MVEQRIRIAASLLALLLLACGGDAGERPAGGSGPPDPPRDYRAAMRTFVERIAHDARETNPEFLIVPQNGQELFTAGGAPGDSLAASYLEAIDGTGREDLFYGYEGDNLATPEAVRLSLDALLALGEQHGVEALVTDYCRDREKMEDSYARNLSRGYISFAADRRELDRVPSFPAEPHRVNTRDVRKLADARNFLYLIDPGEFPNRRDLIDALAATDFDLLILDAFFTRDEPLTPKDLARLHTKAHGGRRLVLAYLSIGEAETYRYYWRSEWESRPPAWLADPNPDWAGNIKVRYWDPAWQTIITGGPDAYVRRLVDAGFDGAYLDIVDAFESFEDRSAAVESLISTAAGTDGGF